MTSFTTPKTWTSTTLTAAELNEQIRDNTMNLDERLTLHGITSESTLNKVKIAKCGVLLDDTGTQSISDSTDTSLTWDTETYDTDAFHSTSVNTARITIPSGLDGTYHVWASIRFDASATGDRRLWIAQNAGGDVLVRQMQRATVASYAHLNVSAVVDLAAGDYIYAAVYQSSTGSLSVDKSITSSHFGAVRLFAS